MPHSRANLQRQLEQAGVDLAARAAQLDERGLEPGQRQRDPGWRNLTAKRTQLQNRLKRAEAIAALDDELRNRKAEKASAPKPAEKPKKTRKKDKAAKSGREAQPAAASSSKKKKTDKKQKTKGKKKS